MVLKKLSNLGNLSGNGMFFIWTVNFSYFYTYRLEYYGPLLLRLLFLIDNIMYPPCVNMCFTFVLEIY